MSTATKRPRAEVLAIAETMTKVLRQCAVKLEIAGSLRRETRECGDIELVAIPRITVSMEVDPGDIFKGQKRVEVNRLWEILDVMAGRGYTKCGEKYRQFAYALPGMQPIKVDLFTATPETWGWIYLIRTGSADFSHHVAKALNKAGYTSSEGAIHRGDLKLVDGAWKLCPVGPPIKTPTEQDVFDLARIPFREPRQRF
jgi:DNA polymerase/3'-5' exonuclease PolX